MAHCPTCGRPRAAARATCLYCGAPLPAEPSPGAEALPAARAGGEGPPRPGVEAGGSTGRWLLVIDLGDAAPDTVARGLDRSLYEAGLLVRRGGWHLHRALDEGPAAEEALRLGALGLHVVVVPEAETRARPLRTLAGERGEGALDLRTEEGSVVVLRGDLLLVVAGPISRQYQTPSKQRRIDTARPDEGYRVHLHRHADPRPLEIDAACIEPGFAVTGSARLEVDAWVDEVAGDAPRDDGFRFLPPALAPAEPEPKGALAAVRSLGLASRDAAGERRDRAVVLDNVAQFRFYSGWRAAATRRRARGC